MNKFQKWIAKAGGTDAVAKKLGVSRFAVLHWQRGKGWPRIAVILELVRVSRGELTVMDIIDCTWPKSRRG